MKLLIDGKEVPFQNDVKVIVEDEDIGEDSELHLTFTHEGVVTDIIDNGQVTATDSDTYTELFEATGARLAYDAPDEDDEEED